MTVCLYIMFWAKTGPAPDATTDFGEIGPVIVVASFKARSDDGIPGVVVVVGAVLVPTEPTCPAGTVRVDWRRVVPWLSTTNAAAPATATAVSNAPDAIHTRRRRRFRAVRRSARTRPRPFDGGVGGRVGEAPGPPSPPARGAGAGPVGELGRPVLFRGAPFGAGRRGGPAGAGGGVRSLGRTQPGGDVRPPVGRCATPCLARCGSGWVP